MPLYPVVFDDGLPFITKVKEWREVIKSLQRDIQSEYLKQAGSNIDELTQLEIDISVHGLDVELQRSIRIIDKVRQNADSGNYSQQG